jgi:DNA-binding GntR family transcriptional regulator
MLDFIMLDTQSPFFTPSRTDGVSLTESKLRSAIISGLLAPGGRLSEIEICKTYGQGRGIVRAALSKLAYAGFVVSQPRSGWRVSPISAAGLREIIMARSRLEGLLAEVPLSEEDLAHIQTICDMQAVLWAAASIVPSEHGSLLLSYDRQVRDMLAAKLKAPLIASWLGNLWDKSERYLNYFERSHERSAPLFDWAPFIEAKRQMKHADASYVLDESCAAFARFAQASLLESDLIAPETHKETPRASRTKAAAPQESSLSRERPSKRTI